MPREGHDRRHDAGNGHDGDFNPRAPRGARQGAVNEGSGATYISIHVPREGHDKRPFAADRDDISFQSTCPARGTTICQPLPCPGRLDFNPRAPRGARLAVLSLTSTIGAISIHVPREGHDARTHTRESVNLIISIHVPREGHDDFIGCVAWGQNGISIHVPREGHDL